MSVFSRFVTTLLLSAFLLFGQAVQPAHAALDEDAAEFIESIINALGFGPTSLPRCDTQVLGKTLKAEENEPKSDLESKPANDLYREAEVYAQNKGRKDLCRAARRYFALQLVDVRLARAVDAQWKGIQALYKGGFLEDLFFEIENYRAFYPRDKRLKDLDFWILEAYSKYLKDTDVKRNPKGIRERDITVGFGPDGKPQTRKIPMSLVEELYSLVQQYQERYKSWPIKEFTDYQVKRYGEIRKMASQFLIGRELHIIRDNTIANAKRADNAACRGGEQERFRAAGMYQVIYFRLQRFAKDGVYRDSKYMPEALYYMAYSALRIAEIAPEENKREGWRRLAENVYAFAREVDASSNYTRSIADMIRSGMRRCL